MSDLYHEMLQRSMDREAANIVSNKETEKQRYGNLLENIKGRDCGQEEADRKNAMISSLASGTTAMKEKRNRESMEHSAQLQRIIGDVRTRDKREADDFINRNKGYLDRGKEAAEKERRKGYFS